MIGPEDHPALVHFDLRDGDHPPRPDDLPDAQLRPSPRRNADEDWHSRPVKLKKTGGVNRRVHRARFGDAADHDLQIAVDVLRPNGGLPIINAAAFPSASFRNLERLQHLPDFRTDYPWDHPSTNIQLRAWTRLLFVNKMVQCFGCDISYEAGNHLFNNDIFLHEAVDSRAIVRTHIWDPEAHALFPSESILATATDTLPTVMAFLREHDLPSEPTNLGRKRGKA